MILTFIGCLGVGFGVKFLIEDKMIGVLSIAVGLLTIMLDQKTS